MRRALMVVSVVCGVALVGCVQTSADRVRSLTLFGQGRSVMAYDIMTNRILFDRAGVARDFIVTPAAVRVAVKELCLRHHAVWVEDKPSSKLVFATFPVATLFDVAGRDAAVAIRIESRKPNGSRVTVLVEPVNQRGDRSIEISAEKVHEDLRLLVAGQAPSLTGTNR